MSGSSFHIRLLSSIAVYASISLLLPPAIHADEPPADPAQKEAHSTDDLYDCGTIALYNLHHLERGTADLDAIERALPQLRPGGYSMKELRDASRTLGLALTGVLLNKEERALDRPMLVFLKRSKHGHFLVIRPVGHTGKLIQVIDSIQQLDVIDKSTLLASSEWTGLALVPSRPNWMLRIAGGVATGLAVVGFIATRARRGAQESPLDKIATRG
ncbi:MAG: hypothetical protein KGM43_19080 [Planctomycetota bacterium]|nr:hypothetical protein [Planctomycetota bacterium]